PPRRPLSLHDALPILVMDILRKPVVAARDGYVLDGFPRTVDQAQAAYAVAQPLGAEVQAAIHLDVPQGELVRRLLARGRGADDSDRKSTRLNSSHQII